MNSISKNNLIIIYAILGLVLVGICFMPWAYYPDIDKNFTGFYSYHNTYGKPGISLVGLWFLNGVLLFFSRLWARVVSLGIMTLFFAFAISRYILYSGCNSVLCPEVKIGLYLMIIFCLAIFVISLYGKVKKTK